MATQKPKFVQCPRCELNYFSSADKKRKYCDICLAELNLVDPSILIPDEDAELEVLCPVCKINYMAPEDDICFLCQREQPPKIEKEDDLTDSWESFVEADEPLDDDMEVSLSELDEEDEEDSFDDSHDTMGDGFEDVEDEDDWIDIEDDEEWDEDEDDEDKDDE